MKAQELIDRLNALPDAEKQKPAVDVLQSHAHAEVFQTIYSKGFDTAYGKEQEKLAAERGKVTDAEQKLRATEAQMDELRKKNPDAASLQEKFQSDLQKLQDEHKQALEKVQGQLDTERRAGAREKLVRELTAMGVDSEYAEVLADKQETKSRIRPKEDGSVEVLQAGKEIALAHSAEKGPIKLLAEELAAKVPAKFKASDADTGSGITSDNGKPSGSKMAENIRKQEQERAKTGLSPEKRNERLRSAGVLRHVSTR